MLPLLPDGPLDAVVAYQQGQAVTRETLLAHVEAVSALLPADGAFMNLCNDRYWFAVGLLAAIARGGLSLLPHSDAPGHLAELARAHSSLICLTSDAEGERRVVPGVPALRIDAVSSVPAVLRGALPRIASSQKVVRVYTSGSTGQPQGFDKYFGYLWAGMQAASRRIWAATSGPCAVVGTSSFRHMFGFEATVLLPLWCGGVLSAAVPFFPADVAAAMAAMPAPCLLVTTPYHLRNLLDSGVAFPPIAGILSATAPLSPELAQRAEAAWQAPILEAYGATELGMTATRQPCRDQVWSLLDGLSLSREAPDRVLVSGPSLPVPQPLNDVVECLDEAHFRLLDRGANLINIVGKRSSLSLLNHLLQAIPGVRDGVFCLPFVRAYRESAGLAAFVVGPGLKAADIWAGLRAHVDPVFLPRPIVFVDSLPRDSNGKLPAAGLRALMDAHLR